MYRPQFAYPTPAGYVDEEFIYCFDSTNCPALVGTLAAGMLQLSGIPLLLQQDAPFLWRGTTVQDIVAGGGSTLSVQFKDCNGNYLSDSLMPINLSYAPSGLVVVGTLDVVMESERICPPGGVITVYFQNTSLADANYPRITLFGAKRRCLVRPPVPPYCLEAA